MAGSIQPAVDEIVDMCLVSGLANKKTSLVRIAESTHVTVREQVLTRSMHSLWL